jgi:hypothetical protein
MMTLPPFQCRVRSTPSARAVTHARRRGAPALSRTFASMLERLRFGLPVSGYLVRQFFPTRKLDRLALDMRRTLSPGAVSDELFFVEHYRSVLSDNTFSQEHPAPTTRLAVNCDVSAEIS